MPTTDAAVESLLSDLVRIDSVTPWLIPGAAGEGAVARHIADWFADLEPVEATLEEVEPGRPNVIVRLRGSGGGPNLYLNAHSDTVGYANWREEALVPVRDGDRLIGIGVADDKSSCAMGMLAMRALAGRRTKLAGDLVLACTVDEEGASIGTQHLIAGHPMDATLILEPEGIDRIVVEHQGFGWLDIVVHGRAAHGSDPGQGIDAIVHMAEVVRRLHELDGAGFGQGDGGRNGRTVFHTGTISGGTDYATYPTRCVLGIEIGTQPGEHLTDRIREIEAIFDDVRSSFPGFRGEVIARVDREPFRAAGHERLLDALANATERVLGRPLEAIGLNAWCDSGLTQGAGIPTLCYGALGGNFHTPGEWVSVSEIVQGVEILERTIETYLG
ncbi:MAG: M20/M25/M40 family metallo-hydrolase [Chloroflexi bacterium]|nr:M20/M25/M40 family metallo-hydrolase [Chloroflexota bacterium]